MEKRELTDAKIKIYKYWAYLRKPVRWLHKYAPIAFMIIFQMKK